MSELLEINGETYMPSRIAASEVGYTGDYVARLAREEIIEATKVGSTWFVSLAGLQDYVTQAETDKELRKDKLREERKAEIAQQSHALHDQEVAIPIGGKMLAVAQTGVILILGFIVGASGYVASTKQVAGIGFLDLGYLEEVAISFYKFISPSWKEEYSRADVVTSTNGGDIESNAVVDLNTQDFDIGSEVDSTAELSVDHTDPLKTIRDSFSDSVEITLDEDHPEIAIVKPIFDNSAGRETSFVLMPMPQGEVETDALYEALLESVATSSPVIEDYDL